MPVTIAATLAIKRRYQLSIQLTLTKLGELAHHVCTHITSKRIELEGPGWSGLVRF